MGCNKSKGIATRDQRPKYLKQRPSPKGSNPRLVGCQTRTKTKRGVFLQISSFRPWRSQQETENIDGIIEDAIRLKTSKSQSKTLGADLSEI